MQTKLYPAELAEDSLEAHLARHSRRSRAVYLATVLAGLGALALLPVVRVGVTVQGQGIVRPVVDKHEVRARAAGLVEEVAVRAGDRVARGQLLMRLRPEPLQAQASLLDAELDRTRALLADLQLLTRARDPATLPREALRTDRYRQELEHLRSELAELELRRDQAARERERTLVLVQRGLLPLVEAEQGEQRLAGLLAERGTRLERFRTAWHAALAEASAQVDQLRARQRQLGEEGALLRVEAPVAGTVVEVVHLAGGSFVQAGERVAVLSPAAGMVAEVYVAPRDVGLIRVGAPARVLVDAFDHRHWGVLPGHVRSISEDYLLVGDRPVFRVVVALERAHLTLRNGARGELRKGMTLRARFLVAERSLWQLLRDDVADWVRPH